ncbi:MAG: hypothetical protein ACOCZ8_04250, partial [Bacteroidota bacterium]
MSSQNQQQQVRCLQALTDYFIQNSSYYAQYKAEYYLPFAAYLSEVIQKQKGTNTTFDFID